MIPRTFRSPAVADIRRAGKDRGARGENAGRAIAGRNLDILLHQLRVGPLKIVDDVDHDAPRSLRDSRITAAAAGTPGMGRR